jgi:hypothetical protein
LSVLVRLFAPLPTWLLSAKSLFHTLTLINKKEKKIGLPI